MTTSLSELIAQKDALERQIREARSSAKANAVAQVRELMAQHGLTAADLIAPTRSKQGVKAGSKVQPKYRDPSSGSTWSGRGLKPKWLTAAIEAGKTIQDFAI
jgi:DNA-binding protein H-NS